MPPASRIPIAVAVSVGVSVLLVGGCSTYDGTFLFQPTPAVALVTSPGQNPVASARLLASVVGVRRADTRAGMPESIELRVRVENTGATPVSFDPTSMVLLTGTLEQLPAPFIVDGDGASVVAPTVVLPPGAWTLTTACFPLPDSARSLDLIHLDLQWSLDLDGAVVTGRAPFTRRVINYYFGPSYTTWWWSGGLATKTPDPFVSSSRGRPACLP